MLLPFGGLFSVGVGNFVMGMSSTNECRMFVFLYYIVFAMRNESTMVNSKKKSVLLLLFNIAMHDPIIFLSYLTATCYV